MTNTSEGNPSRQTRPGPGYVTEARLRKVKHQKGYMLLSVMLVMTLMLIALTAAIPRITQQIQREKEEELVHRGEQYAIAVKKFYRKNGFYPVSVEQLESTNNMRFLRKRYKDPFNPDKEWKLVHPGEAQNITSNTTAAASLNQGNSLTTNNTAAAGAAGSTGLGANSGGSALSSGFNNGGLGSGGSGTGGLGSGGLGSGGLGSGGLGSGTQGAPGPTASPSGTPSTTGQMGTLTTQNIGNGTGGQGGGPIIGVASTSSKKSIKEFNGNNEYDQWLFVYDLQGDMAGTGGVKVAAPIGTGTSASGLPQPVQGVRTAPSPAPATSPNPQ